jgi:hypothetical protein
MFIDIEVQSSKFKVQGSGLYTEPYNLKPGTWNLNRGEAEFAEGKPATLISPVAQLVRALH